MLDEKERLDVAKEKTIEEVASDLVKKFTELRGVLKIVLPYRHRQDIKRGMRILLDASLSEFKKTIDEYFSQVGKAEI